jgi:hypothetical protein
LAISLKSVRGRVSSEIKILSGVQILQTGNIHRPVIFFHISFDFYFLFYSFVQRKVRLDCHCRGMSRSQRSMLQIASAVLLFIVYLASTPTPLPPRTALLSYPEQPAAHGRIRKHDSFSTQRAREFDEIPQQDNGEVDVDVSDAPMQEQVSNMDITAGVEHGNHVAMQRPHSHRRGAVAVGGGLTGHHDALSFFKKREGRMTELHILTAHERGEFKEIREEAHMKRVAAQVSRLSALRARLSRAAASSAGHHQSAAGQQLAHWPYEHSSAVMGKGESLDTLGRAIDDSAPEERQLIKHYILDEFQHKPGTPMLDDRRADFSEANPPCYSAEDCHRFVVQQPGSHLQKESDLPVYDNDMLELVSFGKCGRFGCALPLLAAAVATRP